MTWGAELVAVLVEDDDADPVQGAFDGPVALDPGGDVGGWGGDQVEGADRVDDLPQVIATLRNTVISLRRITGWSNISAGLRHHAREPTDP